MSQILRDLNKFAASVGAPVVGQNISEQVRALSVFFGSTSHGANIAERINELRHGNIGGSTVEHTSLVVKPVFSRIAAVTKEE